MTLAIALTLLALLVLLIAEARRKPGLRAVAKSLASTGFVAVALTAGALDSPFGRALLVALAFSWLGDVALLGNSDRSFRLGLVLFLVGHLGFDVAFLIRGASPLGAIVGAWAVVIPAALVYRTLSPHIIGPLRRPVQVYLGVISTMVALSLATAVAHGGAVFVLAAGLFFASDVMVAREKFVESTFLNPLFGLPLYYVAQLLFASSPAWS
jgi:uncharacterized membrane protein YhhN